jgi:hypothetical protein
MGWGDEWECGSDDEVMGLGAFRGLIARAEDAQIRMQAELMLVRVGRYLRNQAAYHDWCRDRGVEA